VEDFRALLKALGTFASCGIGFGLAFGLVDLIGAERAHTMSLSLMGVFFAALFSTTAFVVLGILVLLIVEGLAWLSVRRESGVIDIVGSPRIGLLCGLVLGALLGVALLATGRPIIDL